ncbi:MAG: glycoside hydrolase family 16 protein [Tannerella sp.]|nr:glycoside hydrolase family 16 protein [Tannerella sp.]
MKSLCLTAGIIFCINGCKTEEEKAVPLVNLPSNYELVFQDEFNSGNLDTDVWGFHNPGKRRSAVNVKEACLLNKNGELEIRNWTEITGNDTTHYAGMIETKENFVFGYYEARIKFDIEMGSWGAFWIMYNASKIPHEANNPKEGGVEIDIIEFVPRNNRYGCHNLHWNGYGEYHKSEGSGEVMNGRLEGYHTYSLLWTPEEYVFYIDGEKTWSSSGAVSHTPEYVIISTEIEDHGWAGDISTGGYGTFDKTKNIMYVDYVRIFQEKK